MVEPLILVKDDDQMDKKLRTNSESATGLGNGLDELSSDSEIGVGNGPELTGLWRLLLSNRGYWVL